MKCLKLFSCLLLGVSILSLTACKINFTDGTETGGTNNPTQNPTIPNNPSKPTEPDVKVGEKITFTFVNEKNETFKLEKEFDTTVSGFNLYDETVFTEFHLSLKDQGLQVKEFYWDLEMTSKIGKGETIYFENIKNKSLTVYYVASPDNDIWVAKVKDKVNSFNFEQDFVYSRIVVSSGREEVFVDYNHTTKIAKGELFSAYILDDECLDSEGNYLYTFNFTWNRETGVITFKRAQISEFLEKGEEAGETVVSKGTVTWDTVIATATETLRLDSLRNKAMYIKNWTSENELEMADVENNRITILNLMNENEKTTFKIVLPKDKNYIYCLTF